VLRAGRSVPHEGGDRHHLLKGARRTTAPAPLAHHPEARRRMRDPQSWGTLISPPHLRRRPARVLRTQSCLSRFTKANSLCPRALRAASGCPFSCPSLSGRPVQSGRRPAASPRADYRASSVLTLPLRLRGRPALPSPSLPRRKSMRSRLTSSGRSSFGMCPAPGRRTGVPRGAFRTSSTK